KNSGVETGRKSEGRTGSGGNLLLILYVFIESSSMELKSALAVLGCISFATCVPGQDLLSSPASNPIPAGRGINWSRTGVPGGIPERTAIGARVDPLIYGNGTTDATEAIQSAIHSCPENQVVYLPAGIYLVQAGLGSTT